VKLILICVLSFGTASYAECSKDEVIKMIDIGFSKTDIKEMCNKKVAEKKVDSTKNPFKSRRRGPPSQNK
jgi:hypothetical protein